jgi:hypothetical protein
MKRIVLLSICAVLVSSGPALADELTADDGRSAVAKTKSRQLGALDKNKSPLQKPVPSTGEGALKGYGLSLGYVPAKHEIVNAGASDEDPLSATFRDRSSLMGALDSKPGSVGGANATGKMTSGLNITGGRNAFATLKLEKVDDLSTENGLLRLHVSLAHTKDLKGYGFSLHYDPAKYELMEARELEENLLKSGPGQQTLFVSANHAPGRVDLGAVKVDGQGVSGDGRLVELTFKTDGEPASSDFRISEGVLVGLDGAIDRLTTVEFARLTPQSGEYGLDQNAPNPFNPSTVIGYRIPEASPVRLAIYNLLGQEVRVLIDQPMEAGSFTATWDGMDEMGRRVASGIYLYRVQAADFTASKRMMLLK